MKKIYLTTVALIMASCLISCSNDEGEYELYREKESTSAEELLKSMNIENPLSEIGITHNKVLKGIMGNHNPITRSSEDSINLFNSIRNQALVEYIATGDTADVTTVNFLTIYDSVAYVAVNHNDAGRFRTMYPVSTHGQLMYACMSELDNVFEDNDTDITSLLSRLQTVQNAAKAISSDEDRNIVFTCVSVAANSLEYWEEEFSGPSSATKPKNWKRIAKSDVKGAQLGYILSGTGFWGWVGGAIVGGGASAIAYYFQ